jgi:hypothetical protein
LPYQPSGFPFLPAKYPTDLCAGKFHLIRETIFQQITPMRGSSLMSAKQRISQGSHQGSRERKTAIAVGGNAAF